MKKNRWIVVIGMIGILCVLGGCGQSDNSVSDNEVSGNAAVSQTPEQNEGIWNERNQTAADSETEKDAVDNTVSDMTGPYSGHTDGVDYAKGSVVVDFSNASTDIEIASVAKQAMAGQAYFSGKAVTVNDILTGYGAGEWSAIVSPQDDVCVWYAGMREEQEFKVNFEVYEDGVFLLESITIDGELIDDYADYMDEVICR